MAGKYIQFTLKFGGEVECLIGSPVIEIFRANICCKIVFGATIKAVQIILH
jgi:hypothetical protein